MSFIDEGKLVLETPQVVNGYVIGIEVKDVIVHLVKVVLIKVVVDELVGDGIYWRGGVGCRGAFRNRLGSGFGSGCVGKGIVQA